MKIEITELNQRFGFDNRSTFDASFEIVDGVEVSFAGRSVVRLENIRSPELLKMLSEGFRFDVLLTPAPVREIGELPEAD